MKLQNNSNQKIILFLIDQFWSGKGGSEQNLLWLLKKLPQELFITKIVVFSNVLSCGLEKFPVEPIIFGRIFGQGLFKFKKRFFALVMYIKTHGVDVVHAFTIRDELLGVLACWIAGRGAVCGHRRNLGYSLTFWKILVSKIVQLFKIKYIANSNAAKLASCQKEGIDPECIDVIYNPVFLDRAQSGFNKIRTKDFFGVPKDAYLIGMVATVKTIKGYETLLYAAKKVLNKIPNVYFLSIGEQQDVCLRNLKNLADDLQINDFIIWHGGVDNPFEALFCFDVAVLSSKTESFSNAVLEYAIAGKAIVATDVGGMREIISDGESGFLVPPNCPEVLADRIIELLENPEKRKMFADKAQNYVLRKFSEDEILKKYVDFYSKLTS